jgi:hypothetical protein
VKPESHVTPHEVPSHVAMPYDTTRHGVHDVPHVSVE